MTVDRGFKRLVRQRAQQTGETYTAARAALLSDDLMLARQLMSVAGMAYTTFRATQEIEEVPAVRNAYTAALREQPGWMHPPNFSAPLKSSTPPADIQRYRNQIHAAAPRKVRIASQPGVRRSVFRPRLARVERDHENTRRVLVINGHRIYHGRAGAVELNRLQAIGSLELEGGIAFLLDPTWFASADGLELIGRSVVGDRPAIRVRRDPRRVENGFYPGLGWAGFAAEFELDVDVATGILLRTVERFSGEAMRIGILTEVQIDLPLDPGLFRMPGPATEPPFVTKFLDLVDASREVSFPVFRLDGPPLPLIEPLGKTFVHLITATGLAAYPEARSDPPATVGTSYGEVLPDGSRTSGLSITQTAAQPGDDAPSADLTRRDVSGEPLWVAEAPGPRGSQWARVRMVRLGTVIELTSTMSLEVLIDHARRMTPVSGT